MSTLTTTRLPEPSTPTSIGGSSIDDVLHECLAQGNRARIVRLAFEERRLESVVESLQRASTTRAEDIRTICEENSETFFKWISELNVMRQEAQNVRKAVADGNQELQRHGGKLLEALIDLRKYIEDWDREVSSCMILKSYLDIAELSFRATKLVEERQLYDGVLAFQEVEKRCKAGLPSRSFQLYMDKELKNGKENLNGVLMLQFNHWLSSIRTQGKEIGYKVLQHAAEKQGYKDQCMDDYKHFIKHVDENESLPRKIGDVMLSHTRFGRSLQKMDRKSTHRTGLGLSSLVPHDILSPARLSWHLHRMIDRSSELRKYYKENRRLQLYSDLNMLESQSFLDVYQSYFKQLLGFFSIEKAIARLIPELVLEEDLDSLWELASTSTSRIVKAEAEKLSDPSVLLLIHDYFKLVMAGFEILEVKTVAFDAMFKTLRERYYGLLCKDIEKNLHSILDSAQAAKKLKVNEAGALWCDIQRFGLNFKLEASWDLVCIEELTKLPWSASFSIRVVDILHVLYSFLDDVKFFLSSIKNLEVGKVLRRYRNRLLADVVVRCMEEHLQQCYSTSSDFLVGLLASDAHALACSMTAMDAHIEQMCLTYNIVEEKNIDPASSRTPLLQLEGQAQGLYAQIFLKQLDAMATAMLKEVDWAPANVPESASAQSVNIAATLTNKFDLMNDFLPSPAREQLCTTAFRKLGEKLLQVFTSPLVTVVNTYGLIALEQDVLLLKELAAGTIGATAGDALQELNHLLDLLLHRASDLLRFVMGEISLQECFHQADPLFVLSLAKKFNDQKFIGRLMGDQVSTLSTLYQSGTLKELVVILGNVVEGTEEDERLNQV